MLKFGKFVLLLFALLVVVAIALPIVAYRLDQPHQREIQAKVLNGNFAKVQLQNGKVSMVPAANRHLMRTLTAPIPRFNSFNPPMVLSVGSQFKASDRHWGATYTITRIEPDGVVIHFEASGGSSATSIQSSAGNVKLGWK